MFLLIQRSINGIGYVFLYNQCLFFFWSLGIFLGKEEILFILILKNVEFYKVNVQLMFVQKIIFKIIFNLGLDDKFEMEILIK